VKENNLEAFLTLSLPDPCYCTWAHAGDFSWFYIMLLLLENWTKMER